MRYPVASMHLEGARIGSFRPLARGTGLIALAVGLAICLLLTTSSRAQSPFSGSYPLLGEEVIRYKSTPPNDPVASLQRRLDEGKAALTYAGPHGYLLSVLKELKVPLSSQMLVFSRTGFQQSRISPSTPRALYFNDNVYVGWVQGGEVVELAAVDPAQGTMFYTLDQRATGQPKFVRREECLQCHGTPKTVGVPGLLMRSVFTAKSGLPELYAASFDTDQSTPLNHRWGGWYVTGTHGSQRHMGNVMFTDAAHPDQLDMESGANITSLAAIFDVTPYATPHSDLVALMVLAHQAHLHNVMSRVNWETRFALNRQALVNKPLGLAVGKLSDPETRHVNEAVEVLMRNMLFTDETALKSPVEGTSEFAKQFPAAGPKDSAGRSLRDFDLTHRMFRYPCSFLIYSESFDALPKLALDRFYLRLWEVLTGKDKDPAFTTLGQGDRAAILSILRQTKQNLPVYWQASAQSPRSTHPSAY